MGRGPGADASVIVTTSRDRFMAHLAQWTAPPRDEIMTRSGPVQKPSCLDWGELRGQRKVWMSKEDLIELQGVVTEVLAGGNYKVKVGENHEVLARPNGKMRQYRIRVIQGDRVTVGVSPYDLKRGLITYRAK